MVVPIKNKIMGSKIVRNYELTPKNGRKSFYGKAYVVEWTNDNDELFETLYSYNYPIITRDSKGNLTPNFHESDAERFLTQTTCAHIKSFCGLTKKDVLNLF